jgi:hypothetical protein
MDAQACDRRLPLEETDDLTIDERIAKGDREAIYDAIVEATVALDILRADIGGLLAEGSDAFDRLAEVRAARLRNGDPKETAARDRSGKERQRSRINRRSTPANHG